MVCGSKPESEVFCDLKNGGEQEAEEEEEKGKQFDFSESSKKSYHTLKSLSDPDISFVPSKEGKESTAFFSSSNNLKKSTVVEVDTPGVIKESATGTVDSLFGLSDVTEPEVESESGERISNDSIALLSVSESGLSESAFGIVDTSGVTGETESDVKPKVEKPVPSNAESLFSVTDLTELIVKPGSSRKVFDDNARSTKDTCDNSIISSVVSELVEAVASDNDIISSIPSELAEAVASDNSIISSILSELVEAVATEEEANRLEAHSNCKGSVNQETKQMIRSGVEMTEAVFETTHVCGKSEKGIFPVVFLLDFYVREWPFFF